jgi:hypothetical protein
MHGYTSWLCISPRNYSRGSVIGKRTGPKFILFPSFADVLLYIVIYNDTYIMKPMNTNILKFHKTSIVLHVLADRVQIQILICQPGGWYIGAIEMCIILDPDVCVYIYIELGSTYMCMVVQHVPNNRGHSRSHAANSQYKLYIYLLI